MSSKFRLSVTTNDSGASVKNYLNLNGPVKSLTGIANYFNRFICGSVSSLTRVATNAVAATGTITFSSIADADTVTVNGRVYTAKTSGASGAQQFNIGGSDAAAALNFQATLNADTNSAVQGVVTASSSSSAVTLITCLVPGNIGNLCTLAISAHGSVSGANLTGGSEDTPVNISHGI